MKQKKIGNDTESKCLQMLQDNGYWCHLFAYNKNGQPCDIVAIKNNTALLIDVKHCSEERFEFKNIQPNQLSCFEYAQSCGNNYVGFMIYFEKEKTWKWLPYSAVKAFLKNGIKSVKIYETIDCFERWLKSL